MFRLKNQIKHYDWGSPDDIPGLIGADNPSGEPWAELWMGVHPAGASRITCGDHEMILGDLIAEDPPLYLGKEAAEHFDKLPFLFKLLAASRPLSIQAHPNQEQAKRGFERENLAGIPRDAPSRNYRDPNHKPEIICALKPFRAMCGFRAPEEILKRLESLFAACPSIAAELVSLTDSLGSGEKSAALKTFFGALFNLPAETRRNLTDSVLGVRDKNQKDFEEEWSCAAWFAELYPEDPAIISPFYLNLIDLKEGDAVYLPAGVLHAYIQGFGVELMADSDNVLRGGLTPKHVDINELMETLDFSPFSPEILSPLPVSPGVFRYPSPVREFTLYVIKGAGGKISSGVKGPLIVIVTEGTARISAGEFTGGNSEDLVLEKGKSAFIPAGTNLEFTGTFRLFAAGTGMENPGREDPC
jgi:mannose-6-phosphate isomerase